MALLLLGVLWGKASLREAEETVHVVQLRNEREKREWAKTNILF